MLALRALRNGPSYGYAIGAALAGHGLQGVKASTLYPLLARQEAAGLVTAEWRPGGGGPGRKYFTLTPAGEAEAERLIHEWRRFVATAETYMTDGRTR